MAKEWPSKDASKDDDNGQAAADRGAETLAWLAEAEKMANRSLGVVAVGSESAEQRRRADRGRQVRRQHC